MEVELKNKQLEEEHLKQQLETKTQELSSYTLHVIRKNQLLEDLRAKLDEMIKDDKPRPAEADQSIIRADR